MKRACMLASVFFFAAFVTGCEPQKVEPAGEPLVIPAQSEPWQTPYGGGTRIKTAHYSIFTTSSDDLAQQVVPAFLEAARRNYLELTALPEKQLSKSMPVYLLASRDQWLSLTKSIVGEQAAAPFMAIQNGGYCYNDVCVYWTMRGMSTLLVAAHEGMHQFLHHYLKDQLPIWMEEGLCTLAEGYQIGEHSVVFTPDMNAARFADLQSAIARRLWLPMKDLLPMDSGGPDGPYTERRTAYYGQLWALAHFLKNDPRYRAGFESLLSDAAQGNLHKALKANPASMANLRKMGRIYNKTVSIPLFKYYISDDLEAFEKDFKQYAIKLAKM